MRLFIAVNFSDEVKEKMKGYIDNLKAISERGNFTRVDNLHLTVVFIGETNNLSAVKSVMDNIKGKSFVLSIFGLGKFRRYTGDIYWAGVQRNKELEDLQYSLSTSLINEGFNIDRRDFKPHITLGREVVIKDNPSFNIPAISMTVDKISLMKSERLNGKLVYTELYNKKLEDD